MLAAHVPHLPAKLWLHNLDSLKKSRVIMAVSTLMIPARIPSMKILHPANYSSEIDYFGLNFRPIADVVTGHITCAESNECIRYPD